MQGVSPLNCSKFTKMCPFYSFGMHALLFSWSMKKTGKSSFEKFQKQLPFRETYVKYLEENCI